MLQFDSGTKHSAYPTGDGQKFEMNFRTSVSNVCSHGNAYGSFCTTIATVSDGVSSYQKQLQAVLTERKRDVKKKKYGSILPVVALPHDITVWTFRRINIGLNSLKSKMY